MGPPIIGVEVPKILQAQAVAVMPLAGLEGKIVILALVVVREEMSRRM